MTMVEGASFFKVDTVVSLLIWIWMLYFLGSSVVIYRLCASDGCHGVFRAAEATYALHIHAEVRVLVDTCSIVRREIRQLLLRNIPNEVFESFATFSHCGAQQGIEQESDSKCKCLTKAANNDRMCCRFCSKSSSTGSPYKYMASKLPRWCPGRNRQTAFLHVRLRNYSKDHLRGLL